MSSPARPTSPDRGSTANPTCEPRSNGSVAGNDPQPAPSPTGNAPPTHPCTNACRSRPTASASWKPTTNAYATRSLKRSASDEQTPAATRRTNNFRPPSNEAEPCVANTVHHANPQVTGPLSGPAPDNHRVVELPAPQDHQEPRAFPQRRRRGQAAVAGDPRHRGQTGPRTGRRTRPAEGPQSRGPARRGRRVTTGWKAALGGLAIAYPDRINNKIN